MNQTASLCVYDRDSMTQEESTCEWTESAESALAKQLTPFNERENLN